MNRIFKVIWSKTKNCYVVASELAKGRTKAASTGDKAKRLALAAITALMLLPVGGYSYAADTTKVDSSTSDTAVEVYTKAGTDAQIEAANKYTYRKAAELDKKLTDQKTSTALHVSKDGNLIVGTKESQTVKDMEIRGKFESGSISTGDITSTGDVTVKGKMAADGVTDETTKDGTYIKQNNTVGNNLVSLDKQVKANDDRITNVKEYLEQQTSDKYVSKADAAVQDGAIVKAANTIGDNVTKLDAALAKETAARIGADKAQDAVIQQVNQNAANGIATLATAYNNEVASREAADNELNERITNEANAIHDEIKAGDTALDNRITAVKESLQQEAADTYVSKDDASVQDGAVVKANNKVGQNVQALDTALAKETAARIGADKAQDQVIAQVNQNMVDGFNTINTNMANGFAALNAADAAEKEARIGADKKLAEAVNSGLSLSDDNVLQKNTTTVADDGTVTTSKSDANEMILNKGNKNQITLNEKGIKVGTNSSVMDADGIYTGGDTFDAAKAAMSSDGQIKGANGKFTVDASGNTTVTSLDAGTGTIQTKGDLYAKDATFSGDITAKDATLSGDLSAKDGTFSGDLSAKDGTFSGDVSAKDVTATGTLQGAEVTDGTATMKNGNITGVKDLSAETITTSGDATIGGDLTVKGKLNVDEIDLTKNGIVGDNNVTASTKVAAGEITGYKKATSTKDGSEKEAAFDYDENGTSTWAKATDADGNWNKSTMAVEGSGVTSKVIDSEKNSNLVTQTSTQSQSTLTDADKNTNTATQSAAESSSTLKDKDGKTSTFKQRVGEILNQINSSDTVFSKVDQKVDNISSEVTDGTNTTSSTQTTTDITNTANNGTISNTAKNIENTASENITNTAKNGSITNDAKNIANIASETLSNSAKNITNTTTDNMTNTIGKNLTTTVGGDMSTEVTGNQSNTVKGTLTETVTGKVTEDYKSDL
uniref:ESPR-type extended signal peptide-containing protein n=1 Tax=Megasphaera elsdenii TaxID=907 RepID=UPI003FF0544D